MKVSTFTVVVGNESCNARCPFCVSKMTPECGVATTPEINEFKFYRAIEFAKSVGCNTVLLTGKGEPTLFPEQITWYLKSSRNHKIPLIELQTNGRAFYKNHDVLDVAKVWYHFGLTTISLSVVHYTNVVNNRIIFGKDEDYYDFWQVIHDLHEIGFSIRLNCTLLHPALATIPSVFTFINTARVHKVEQITIRNAAKPDDSKNEDVSKYIEENAWTNLHMNNLQNVLEDKCTRLLVLPHGAIVYDYRGQNVCLSNCLTSSTNPEEIRQLIFFPDGHLRYDWKYEGAIIF